MIIGREFAWAHLPKAGGEMTHAMFEVFPELIESADPVHTIEQHRSFVDHGAAVVGRRRVLNIRRLPAWMLSLHQWRAVNGFEPEHRPTSMVSPLAIARSSIADDFLARYCPVGGPQIDLWIRTENMVTDFVEFIRRHAEVNPARMEALQALPRINEMAYEKSIHRWFSLAHLDLMYLNNPRWAALERAVYGNLVDE